VNSVDQFLFAGDTYAAQHASRHFTEHGFHDVQPGAVFRRKDELESMRVEAQPSFRLFGDVGGMIVEQQPNPGLGRVALVQFTQQRTKIGTGVAVSYDLGDARYEGRDRPVATPFPVRRLYSQSRRWLGNWFGAGGRSGVVT
jgi:hypothetical protein